MPAWIWQAVFYGSIVIFWAIVFFVAVFLTRRSLRGVGELSAEETGGHADVSANGHVAPAQPSAGEAGTASSKH
jgi:hypothetical protein